jgi:hypothetical protein
MYVEHVNPNTGEKTPRRENLGIEFQRKREAGKLREMAAASKILKRGGIAVDPRTLSGIIEISRLPPGLKEDAIMKSGSQRPLIEKAVKALEDAGFR